VDNFDKSLSRKPWIRVAAFLTKSFSRASPALLDGKALIFHALSFG
jgi:hypothetical protein